MFLIQYIAPQHEDVHLGAHEAAIGVFRRTDNRLATHIEGGIDDDAISRQALKGLDDIVIARAGVVIDGLNARGIPRG